MFIWHWSLGCFRHILWIQRTTNKYILSYVKKSNVISGLRCPIIHNNTKHIFQYVSQVYSFRQAYFADVLLSLCFFCDFLWILNLYAFIVLYCVNILWTSHKTRHSKELASHCLAKTTLTFIYQFWTLSNAFLSINNRNIARGTTNPGYWFHNLSKSLN